MDIRTGVSSVKKRLNVTQHVDVLDDMLREDNLYNLKREDQDLQKPG